jgi:hypothetical protein
MGPARFIPASPPYSQRKARIPLLPSRSKLSGPLFVGRLSAYILTTSACSRPQERGFYIVCRLAWERGGELPGGKQAANACR